MERVLIWKNSITDMEKFHNRYGKIPQPIWKNSIPLSIYKQNKQNKQEKTK